MDDWFVLGTETYSAAQNKPIRLTYNYSVDMGRYEVRATRLDDKDTSARAAHSIYWESLKGHMETPATFGEMTLLVIKMRATNNLSSNSSRKINAIITRKVRKWNRQSGWSEPVACRSIAWAIADILKAQYGGRLPDARIHLMELEQLDKVWENRGDYFDGIFDSATTIWEAVSKVARCGRALPILQSGMVRIIRDEPKTIPTAMFTPRNIIKDSFSIEYIMPSEDTADSVKVQYFPINTGNMTMSSPNFPTVLKKIRLMWICLAVPTKIMPSARDIICAPATVIAANISLSRLNWRD